MHKLHIGSRGPGTTPRCCKGLARANGISTSLEAFEQASESSRCIRCAKLLPKLQRMHAQQLAKLSVQAVE